MANIALIGAAGNVGLRLLDELVSRGHQVTAIGRNPNNIPALQGVTAVRGDINDAAALAQVLKGQDAVISSVRFLDSDPSTLIDTVRASGVKRYLVVGGAASLLVAPGKRLLDQPEFPAEYKAEASAGAVFLDTLKLADDLDWTFLSPSALFIAGERTGVFRLGQEELLVAANGSSISYEDFAIAMVDEIEQPANVKQRFTVGY